MVTLLGNILEKHIFSYSLGFSLTVQKGLLIKGSESVMIRPGDHLQSRAFIFLERAQRTSPRQYQERICMGFSVPVLFHLTGRQQPGG